MVTVMKTTICFICSSAICSALLASLACGDPTAIDDDMGDPNSEPEPPSEPDPEPEVVEPEGPTAMIYPSTPLERRKTKMGPDPAGRTRGLLA